MVRRVREATRESATEREAETRFPSGENPPRLRAGSAPVAGVGWTADREDVVGELKAGVRLRSVTCDTEVVVVKAARDAEVACGGAPMAPLIDDVVAVPLDPDFSGGSALGKRYTDAEGTIEILCVKAGAGTISVDGVALALKVAKALPASD